MLTEATESSSHVSVRAIKSGSRVRSRTYNSAEFFKRDLMLTLRMQNPSGETERFETEVFTGGSARGSPRAPPEGALRLRRRIAAADLGPRRRARRLSEGGGRASPAKWQGAVPKYHGSSKLPGAARILDWSLGHCHLGCHQDAIGLTLAGRGSVITPCWAAPTTPYGRRNDDIVPRNAPPSSLDVCSNTVLPSSVTIRCFRSALTSLPGARSLIISSAFRMA